jgi:tight adherence protein B
MNWSGLILLALLIAALVVGLSLSWGGGDDRMQKLRERLDLVQQAERRAPRASLTLLRDDLLSEVPALQRWLSQAGTGVRLKRWLEQAAVGMRPGKFVLLCAGSSLICWTLLMLLRQPLVALLGLLLGALLPCAWVRHRRQARLMRFQHQFPEAIDLLVRASRAGHPPAAALELIATEMPEPVAGEFRQVFDQQRFGLPLRDCLLNLGERVPLVDVQIFSIAIIIQRESGGNLAEILDKLSSLIRERVKLKRQILTHTAQGRMTTWVLMSLAPILLVVMLLLSKPFMMPMFTDPVGRGMLILGAVLQGVGLLLLRRVVQIRV